MNEPAPLGLYIHWPYCARICPYCDFNVYKQKTVDADAWTKALTTDLAYWAERIERRPICSIYFGGGTPSLAPPETIGAVVEAAAQLFGLAHEPEITIEANPNDISDERLNNFTTAGVNRLSLGVQSLRDDALRFLGRDHDSAAARKAIEQTLASFPKASFDLIYARPDQTDEAWREELNEALQLSPKHLSLYQLTIESGTAFAKAVDAKRWLPPDDETAARHFDIAQALTAEAGLPAYEISNHAAEGHQSQHNLIYWRYQEYIGIGPGAHGRVVVKGEKIATKTHDRPESYLEAAKKNATGIAETESLNEEAQLIERVSMGLRLEEGVSLYADDVFYRNDARAEKLRTLANEGLLTDRCGTIRTTQRGKRLLNRVLYELLG
ncbi:MAG: radical SAM family heme chaperone HemW [Pseudomonadota bacterium]